VCCGFAWWPTSIDILRRWQGAESSREHYESVSIPERIVSAMRSIDC
jgi:hypothetical protein